MFVCARVCVCFSIQRSNLNASMLNCLLQCKCCVCKYLCARVCISAYLCVAYAYVYMCVYVNVHVFASRVQRALILEFVIQISNFNK